MSQIDTEELKSQLLEKLKLGTIKRREAEQLREILEREKAAATSQGDVALVLGIAVLLGFVLKYLSDEKVIDLGKLTRYFSRK
jgi:hypothetical protein